MPDRPTQSSMRCVSCKRPARFIYQVIAGRIEPLCGIHARRFQGSPNLRPVR